MLVPGPEPAELITYIHYNGSKTKSFNVKKAEQAVGKNWVHPSMPDHAACLVFSFTFFFRIGHTATPLESPAVSQTSILL